MSRTFSQNTTASSHSELWRMAVIALSALILCSCRSPAGQRETTSNTPIPSQNQPAEAGAAAPAVVPTAYTAPAEAAKAEAAQAEDEPCPQAVDAANVPWAPPGIARPWPKDEYLRDGGDEGVPVGVGKQWEVLGLGMEDAVAHYDTLDGRTVVEPSNKVYIYAPRFGSVRQVVGLVANEEHQRAGGVHMPEKLSTPTTLQIVRNAKQHVQPGDEISARPPVALRRKQGKDVLSSAIGPKAFQNAFKPYENLAIIRMGMMEAADMPFLARGSTAAIAWSNTESVQVMLDQRSAMCEVKYDKSDMIYTVSEPPGKPKLQLVKVASTSTAKPGDEVEFTLRFDNVGNQPIGNVTIIDSLNTRLEYVPDSAQCSVEAKFLTEPNDGGSVVVRCEVTDPLKPGQGGILRFRCRVR